MQLKTNIAPDSFLAVKDNIRKKFPDQELKFEIEDEGKVLHIYGLPEDEKHAAIVESTIQETGFSGSWLQRGLENK